MRTIVSVLVIVLCCALVLPSPAPAQKKLAQTGMKFLNVLPDARAVAMGEAFTAVEGSASSLFYNSASMARLKGSTSIFLGRTNWIADMHHMYAAASFSPFDGEYGVIGLFFQSVDYGDFEETIRASNDRGYLDLGTFSPTGIMFGVGYARALNDKFSVGGNLKYVRQSLGESTNDLADDSSPLKASNTTSVFAFDFGILYRTGFKSLNFGMDVRNFSKEVTYQKEGFQLPLTFRIGVAMNVLDLTDLDPAVHHFLVSVDAEHPRDYPEMLRVGGEYTFMNMLALRIGYVSSADEFGVSYGAGVRKEIEGFGLGFDYAYVPFGIFDAVHRFSFQFSL
jgi:hypothetical protein